MLRALDYKKLRRKVNISSKGWNIIKEKHPLKTLIGQDRALQALEFGIGNKSRGFNIYVSGYPGSGKRAAINHFLAEKAKSEICPGDWCYVNNFKEAYCPKKLGLEKGGALVFKNEIAKLIEEAQIALLKAFDSKEYANKRQDIFDEFQEKEVGLFQDIYEKASANNFAISRTPIEINVVPIDDAGDPISDKSFLKLSKKKQDKIIEKRDMLLMEFNALLRQNRELDKERKEAVIQLENDVALYAIESLLEELKGKYKKNHDVIEYLEDVKNDIIENLGEFIKVSNHKNRITSSPMHQFLEYEINIITDNSDTNGAPIMMELNPTYNNLFGKVEQESDMGTLLTNFTLIRGGALHRANGGYLIIPLRELLMNYFAWDGLKRALQNNEIVIEDASERFGFLSTKSLKPDPIPLNAKIILLGSPRLYYLLYNWDEDFKELFKVKAEFDVSMDYSASNAKDFASVIFKIQNENNLLPLDHKAISHLIEQSCRIAKDQNKISIRFGELSDILHEANYYAQLKSHDQITSDEIAKAIEAKYYRSNLIQEKIIEMIEHNTLMIDLEGSKIGQINGISVLDLGDFMFGHPNKITVNVASGRSGLIDIERESKLGGRLHTKGVLILSGYLGEKYGQNKMISLFASLVFEQSYSEIEGDSASSTELYAILSSLSQLPIKQSIAVSGSVNQKGEIQPVGAINEKIEGFFEVCRHRGFNGEQGVMIPKGNLDHLMLKNEVVKAVEEGKFHVWAISSIDEGIELLTGVPAGKKLKRGSFSKNSVHYLVDQRIEALNKTLLKKTNKKNKKTF
ncbi:ATP-binding protein [Lutimonas halocynthiae]|uniref:Lon protease family protein n=1 Tax=Lutimonas halocynthiae TaxID=1446477 RepID=UPI0025B4CCF6|nr:ATP-binding protein [Lutimonas halocynthiae]MDN3644574.1 ATP-binding protein [Lutimonas halocynthiae]